MLTTGCALTFVDLIAFERSPWKGLTRGMGYLINSLLLYPGICGKSVASNAQPAIIARMTKSTVTIYTDGGSKPNPGPGGWAALLIFGDTQKELSGGEKRTTNNQMELTAAIEALTSLDEPHEVILYTDSEYLQKGITQWMKNWKKNGWMTASRKPVKNQELWQRLDAALQRHSVKWKWVKGHAGHEYNERVDKMATLARKRYGK